MLLKYPQLKIYQKQQLYLVKTGYYIGTCKSISNERECYKTIYWQYLQDWTDVASVDGTFQPGYYYISGMSDMMIMTAGIDSL